MATSKNFTTSNQFIVYAITVKENSQSVSNNTTNVTVSVRFWRTNTGYVSYGTGKVYCRINGTLYSEDVTPYDEITENGITLFTKTLNIKHNADGTKTLSTSAWIDHEVVTSKEQSFSVKLTTIARASTPSVNAKSTSVSSVTIGDKITIYSNRASTSFTHTAKWKWDGRSGTIGTNIGASTIWTIPSSFVDDIPNASYGTLTIELETFSGGKSIGTKSTSVKAYVPNSLVPRVGELVFTPVTSNTTVESWGVLLQGFSKVKITADVETQNGATVKTYSVTGGGYTGNTKEYTTGLLNKSGEIEFTYKVTDTRGFSASNKGSVTVEPYSQPLILDVTCYRSNEAGEKAGDGQYVFVRCRPQFASCNNRNTAQLVTRVSGLQGSIEIDRRDIENNVAIQFVSDGGLSASGSYTIALEVTDLLGQTARYSTIFPTDNVTIHAYPSEVGGIKFGGYMQSDEEGYFISEYPAVFKKGIYSKVGTVSPIIEEAGTSGIWTYRKWSDGTAECWGNYKYSFGAGEPHTKWGSVYYITEPTPEITYPFAFIDTPNVQAAMFTNTGYGTYWLTPRYKSSLTKTPTYFATRATENIQSGDFIISYNVKGKWK